MGLSGASRPTPPPREGVDTAAVDAASPVEKARRNVSPRPLPLLRLSSPLVVRLWAVTFGVLVLAAVLGLVARFGYGREALLGFVPLFDVDQEANIPSFVSALAWLWAAVLATAIGLAAKSTGDADSNRWLGLGLVFSFLSLDECVSIHERMTKPTWRIVHGGDILYGVAWVLPYALVFVPIGLAYLRFWLRLPVRTRVLTALAAAVFLGGAVGVETLGGWYFVTHGRTTDVVYALLCLWEESFEMAGVTLLIHALSTHLESHVGELGLVVGAMPARTGTRE